MVTIVLLLTIVMDTCPFCRDQSTLLADNWLPSAWLDLWQNESESSRRGKWAAEGEAAFNNPLVLLSYYQDDSDFQYRSFRDHLPLLAVVMIAYIVISQLTERIPGRAGYRLIMHPLERHNRKSFLTIFTIVFVFTLHGTNVIKLLLACFINFAIVKYVSSTTYAPITPLAIWVWNVGFLFLVHWKEGFSYGSISYSLSWLDSYTGLLPRWHINYNITMLRLVSFAMDYFWATKAQSPESPTEEEVR